MRHPFKITFLGQNVTVSVTITNQLRQIHDSLAILNWRRRRDSNPRYPFRYN